MIYITQKIALSGGSELALTYFSLFDRSVHYILIYVSWVVASARWTISPRG